MLDEEDGGDNSRKKLRLSKDQSAVLEESFKEHNTLNPSDFDFEAPSPPPSAPFKLLPLSKPKTLRRKAVMYVFQLIQIICAEFNPTTVPTLSELLGELNVRGLRADGDDGLVYCMDYLEKNIDWLESKLKPLLKDHYLLFDFPGQVELFFLHSNAKVIDTLIKNLDLRARDARDTLAPFFLEFKWASFYAADGCI
ncbi:hypothetical protein ACSBR1_018229 [Camellia fascicularis]